MILAHIVWYYVYDIWHFNPFEQMMSINFIKILRSHVQILAAVHFKCKGSYIMTISADVLEEAAHEVEKLLIPDSQYAELSGKLRVTSSST